MAQRKRYIRLPGNQRRLVSIILGGFVILLVNSLLLLLFDRSTALLYMSNVLLHVALGVLLVVPVLVFLVMHVSKMPLRWNWRATGAGLFTATSLSLLLSSGVGLAVLGATYGGRWLLWLHLATVVTSVLGFALHVSFKRGVRYHFLDWGKSWRAGHGRALRHPLTVTLLAGLALSVLFAVVPWLSSRHDVYVDAGAADPLASSQAILAHEGYLKDADLARSETCGQAGCHPDLFAQWSESVHRFSSFNNPYYRKSIEAMTGRSGNAPARWCASCHDPVVLFTGRFGDAAPLDMDHWTAQEGLTCLSCHAVEGLRDVKGNGRYVIAAPDEYPFARAEGGLRQWIHNKLVRAKPEPHRQAMLKPLHRTQEFCGTCHKVGLPPDVNNYRWKRGQNEYDAWQASGTSGNTVRSFYLPAQPKTCVDCHMPLVPSDDQGNDEGLIRSHRFATANTALPFVNGHADQLRAVENALRDSIATVDVFLVEVNGRAYGPDQAMPVLRPGDRVDVTVVVRNRKVGHALPGGTNDSNELWLELVAGSADGRTVLASGRLDAQGRVDSTAHFWGAVLLDRASQTIDKRNAQDWVATVYAHVIGPGTAHTVHYRFQVPPGPPVTDLAAAFQHRKFKWYFNNWTFRGRVAPGQADSLGRREVDLRRWILDERTAPILPVTTIAQARRRAGTPPPSARPLWERWNDYAIGLFLEGDTRAALDAFAQVAALAPANPEGPVNQARVYLEEGQLERAADALDEAERRRPGYLKTAYFRGVLAKAAGRYDEALAQWGRVYEAYPRDRVLVLGIGRLHYLSGRYEEALTWIDRVLEIDPEDLGGLYNRMLTLGALGREDAFAAAQHLYLYHKDDEAAMAVTAPFKQRHPMANREAQPIHEHELLPAQPAPASPSLALEPVRAHERPASPRTRPSGR